MTSNDRQGFYGIIESITPTIVKIFIKRVYHLIVRAYNKSRYIRRGRFVDLGSRFRFDRASPYVVNIGERTIIEDNNVWNAELGDVTVGKKCWFGLSNVIMGPLDIHDELSTGPYVMILGPRHLLLEMNYDKEPKTVIGNNVKIASGSIVLYGVHIGDGAIIMAGSVVSKDVPEGSVVAGNPARNISGMVKELWDFKRRDGNTHSGCRFI